MPDPEGPNSTVTPGGASKADIEIESREGMAERDGEDHEPDTLFATRRATNSDRISAAMAMTIATMTSRPAAASPPGACRKA